jgi:peptide/nickel transport system ATP-binding protein
MAMTGSGKAVEVGPADQVLNHPREESTKQLLAAVPAI